MTDPTRWFPPLGESLPEDAADALLVGRIWQPSVSGPTPVVVDGDVVRALTPAYATVSELLEDAEPAAAAMAAAGEVVGTLEVSTRTPPSTGAMPRSRGCSPRTICRRSRQPGSPSRCR